VVSFPISGNRTAALTRLGWGTFRIGVKVHWKAGIYEEKTSDFHHDLEFEPVRERTAETFLTTLPKK
jgi:transcription initiation factor IIF auxiliary subunit